MTEAPLPRRGEIWLVDFHPSRGSEQAGRRPALVVQNDHGNRNPRYPNTIVLAMSTAGKPVPLHVRVEPGGGTGLRAVSFVKCEQVLTISKSRLLGTRALGRLPPTGMRRVNTALRLSLALG